MNQPKENPMKPHQFNQPNWIKTSEWNWEEKQQQQQIYLYIKKYIYIYQIHKKIFPSINQPVVLTELTETNLPRNTRPRGRHVTPLSPAGRGRRAEGGRRTEDGGRRTEERKRKREAGWGRVWGGSRDREFSRAPGVQGAPGKKRRAAEEGPRRGRRKREKRGLPCCAGLLLRNEPLKKYLLLASTISCVNFHSKTNPRTDQKERKEGRKKRKREKQKFLGRGRLKKKSTSSFSHRYFTIPTEKLHSKNILPVPTC